jgi:fructokinase
VLDVLCFGEILWDFFASAARDKEPIGRDFRRALGGASANVATGLARLGVRSAAAGAVGRDRLGDALVAHLQRDGVDARFVVRLPARTGLTLVVRDERGRASFSPYRAGSAEGALRAKHIDARMGRARWVLVGTGTLVTADLARATERLLAVASRGRAQVAVDLNVRPHLWSDARRMQRAARDLVSRAALVKASDDDLRALGDGGASLRWLERHAPRASWLVTRGRGAATARGEHGEVELPALPGACVDSTGAGDAFLAGALAVLLAARAVPGSAAWREPAIWRAALRAGHMLGRKAVSRPGAVTGLVNLGRARAVIDGAAKKHHP